MVCFRRCAEQGFARPRRQSTYCFRARSGGIGSIQCISKIKLSRGSFEERDRVDAVRMGADVVVKLISFNIAGRCGRVFMQLENESQKGA